MFKLGSKFPPLGVNKNLETAKFYPGHRAFINDRNRINKTFDKKAYNENKKINSKESFMNNMNKFTPVYFFRKVNSPYKYKMTSVPEYLIKTNEEKHFVDKLYHSLRDESDKDLLNKLIKKRKLKSRMDVYKPQTLDYQNILQYKPQLFNCQLKSDFKENEYFLKDSNYLPEEKKNNKTIIEDETEKNNNLKLDKCSSPERTSKTIQIHENIDKKKNNNRIDTEISKDTQVKYKYKLSDIFNLRKEPVFTNKSAEKYLYKESKNQIDFMNTCPNRNDNNDIEENQNKFFTSSESKSDWIPNKKNYKKMGTYSSVAYNVLSPMYQGSNRFITATELNKDNLYNESTTFHRVKSISEFIDLTRVSATNTLGCFDRNRKMPNFKFRSSVATNQSDEYYINRDLIDKPI